METRKTTDLATPGGRMLTAKQFRQLADVPPELEWLANIANAKTRRAYKKHVGDFASFVGIKKPEDFRVVTRAHVIAWRTQLEAVGNSSATVRAKLSALSSLFEYLSECNAVTHNPVKGVKRPNEGNNEGKTPAISDAQARRLLDAPDQSTVKGKRDRAIIAVFLYHAMRREEVATLNVKDFHRRRDIPYFRITGKRGKVRNVEVHPAASELIHEYLESVPHGETRKGPLFRPVKNNATPAGLDKHLHPDALYKILRVYALEVGIDLGHFSPHALRTTAITNTLENGADIAKVQDWAGHASPATTRLYDRRKHHPQDSPTFKVAY